MARAFDAAKVGAMVWPEIGGIALLILSHLGARFVDGSLGWAKPFRRSTDYVHGAGVLIPAYLVATDRSPDMAKAIAFAEAGILGGAAGNIAYGKTIGKVATRIRSRGLAPRQPGGSFDLLPEAEKRRLIEEARLRAEGVGAGSRALTLTI